MSKRFLSLFLPLLILGCAYSFGGKSLSHLKTVNVQTFVNSTSEDWLDEDLLNYFSTEFGSSSSLKTQTKDADCVLRGEIMTYVDEVNKYDSDDNVENYHIKMSFKVEFYDLVKNKMLYSASSKTYNIIYVVGDPDNPDITADVTILDAQDNDQVRSDY